MLLQPWYTEVIFSMSTREVWTFVEHLRRSWSLQSHSTQFDNTMPVKAWVFEVQPSDQRPFKPLRPQDERIAIEAINRHLPPLKRMEITQRDRSKERIHSSLSAGIFGLRTHKWHSRASNMDPHLQNRTDFYTLTETNRKLEYRLGARDLLSQRPCVWCPLPGCFEMKYVWTGRLSARHFG